MAGEVEFNHFGKLSRRLELLLRYCILVFSRCRGGRRRTFTTWESFRRNGRYLGLCFVFRFGRQRLPSEDSRTFSENLLR